MAEIDEGSVIGNYRVIRLLGQGGMGTVYEVEHLELGTRYALKTFTFDPDSDANHALRKKFLEEGKLLARLKHPNLTHVFDLGFEEKTQMPYFVMDLVVYSDGETYTVEDIELGDITEEMVYRWFKQLASALDYIHGEGIVHRDIKPSNLLVDKDLNVVLTDFGISRIFGKKIKSEVEATRTVVTKTGRGKLVLGTEHYIAPEVAAGEEATPKADAYSLGVMLLRWLTGFYYGDNPGAVALLSRKKYQWLGVISQLLAPAGRRPESYTELVKQVKPAATLAPKPAKRRNSRTTEIVAGAAAALLAIAVLGACGYGVWRYIEKKNAEHDRQVAALAQQIRDREEADRKAKAEAEAARKAKEAEEKRIAEEKRKAREAKIAEQKRIEESRTKIEKQDASQLAVRETPVPEVKKETQEPEPEKPKEEFVVVKDETPTEEVKDYGPIPDVKYSWLKNDNVLFPQNIKFVLSNADTIELVPLKAGTFFMSNNWFDGKGAHKVTITRPFWLSKYCISANQWRDFAPNDCEDCKEIEKIVKTSAVVCKAFQRHSIDAFCDFLTKKYLSKLPKGYVFRLPSEAEWEYAMDIDGAKQKYEQSGKKWYGEFVKWTGEHARESFARFKDASGLERFGKWQSQGWLDGSHIFVGGWTMPMTTGVHDMWRDSVYLLDTIKDGDKVVYSDDEIDPLTWAGPIGDGILTVSRADVSWREYHGNGGRRVFHLVVGPDLISERAWEHKIVANAKVNTPNVPARKCVMDPAKVPHKISKPKEIKFKMACGEDMIFCTVPCGRFNMANLKGAAKSCHNVKISKPFWITKYCVTTKQWREWGQYDCEGMFRSLEKYFPKNQIYPRFNRVQIEKYCEYLTKTYKKQIPPGYVFRLPTEAEWEWAFIADEKGDVRNISHEKFNNYCLRFRTDLAQMMKKNKVPNSLQISDRGVALNGGYIGGRTLPNTFGVCDMWIDWCEEMVLDTFDIVNDKDAEASLVYNEKEEDPLRYAGMFGNLGLSRCEGPGRRFRQFDFTTYFHIVIGPDMLTPLKEKEFADYPEVDFGGDFLGDEIVDFALSSVDQSAANSKDRRKLLFSRENTMHRHFNMREDVRGFHTRNEDSPWVQVQLRNTVKLTGLKVLTYMNMGQTEHIRVWVSNDGSKWYEVARDNIKHNSYSWDFQDKNVKAKFIRIGREPGHRKNDAFALNKILIYGKK